MDFIYSLSLGVKKPLMLVTFNQADKWAANLILAFCIVYLCPTKHDKI